jgi:hypothetical protein
MNWIGWTILLVLIAAPCAYRYIFGKWPLKLDL